MKILKRTHKARILSALIAAGLSLSAWLVGGLTPAFAATSQSVGLRAHILNPPNAITDLAAAPVGSNNGDLQLAWTAPSNSNLIPIDHYLVRYATFPALNAGVGETWWGNAAATQITISPAFAPGTQEFASLSGFTVGTTFYFGIKSVDLDGSISGVDARVGFVNQAQTKPVDNTAAPSTPNNFVGVALNSTSLRWTWDTVVNASFYMINNFPDGAFVGQTMTSSFTETGLTPNQGISRTLRAGNGAGISAPTVVQTIYTLATVPTNLSVTSVGFTNISLSWNANGNSAGTTYRLERSVDNLNFVSAVNTTNTTFDDTSLASLTTYYYRIKAVNDDGIQTAVSAVISTMTMLQLDFIAPNPPLGLKGSLDSSQRAFTLIWEPVTTNTNGTPTTDLVGYNVYRRSTLRGVSARINSSPITVTAYADQVDGKTFYYSVRAIDTSDNESGEVYLADSSPSENVIFLSADGISGVIMPASINNILKSEFNSTGESISMQISEEPVSSNTDIIRTIHIKLLKSHTNEEVKTISFEKPLAIVNMGYNEIGGQVGRGAPNASAVNSSAATGAGPEDLSIWWNNGVNWIKVGGTLDEFNQLLTTKTSYVGKYQLRVAAQSTSLTLNKANVYPRTFTPNNDGYNERVYFVLENPLASNVTGEIFDMKGRFIANLPDPTTTAGVGTTLIWDGKDSSGSVVPSGVYHYRIKGEGKTFTGTVVVAR